MEWGRSGPLRSGFEVELPAWTHDFKNIYIPSSVHWRGPEAMLPIGNEHTSAKTLVSKYCSSLKGRNVPWKNGWFQIGNRECTRWAWNILCQKAKKVCRECKYSSKGKAASMKGQIRDNMGILKIEKKISWILNCLWVHRDTKKGGLFFTKECQLINEEGIIKLGNHYFAVSNVAQTRIVNAC